jgi:hypothetical protein
MTATESEDGGRLEREITIFAADADGCYRRIDEDHLLMLYRPEDIRSLVMAAGFEVQILGDYRSPPVPLSLPGWYVVEARKPM